MMTSGSLFRTVNSVTIFLLSLVALAISVPLEQAKSNLGSYWEVIHPIEIWFNESWGRLLLIWIPPVVLLVAGFSPYFIRLGKAIMRKEPKIFLSNVRVGSIGNGQWAKGIVVSGAPVSADSLHLDAAEVALVVNSGAHSAVTNSVLNGNRTEGSVGIEVKDSPDTTVQGVKVSNFATGVRLEKSERSKVENSVFNANESSGGKNA